MIENELSRHLKDFLENRDPYPFLELLGKLINSHNSRANEIRSILFKLGHNVIDTKTVKEVATIIALKKDKLLMILKENGLNSGYLYSIILNSLLTELKKESKSNIYEIQLEQSSESDDDEKNLLNILHDNSKNPVEECIVEDSVIRIYNLLLENFSEEDFEALCYFLAKNKGFDRSMFLADLEKKNTKDQRVHRAKRKLKQFVESNYKLSKEYEMDREIWLKIYEKIWSEYCFKKVNKGVSNNMEGTDV